MEHSIELDALATLLRPDLECWGRSARVAALTWRDEAAAWPQPIVVDRSRVQVPESLGLRVQRGADEHEVVVRTGGWADVYSFVDGVLEPSGPTFTDTAPAHDAVIRDVDAFLRATTADPQ